MRKLILVLMLTLVLVLVMAGPALAAGVSETGLGRCENPLHAPGTGPAVVIWVPDTAYDHLNGGNSGLIFKTP
jgi:hypothetical protein